MVSRPLNSSDPLLSILALSDARRILLDMTTIDATYVPEAGTITMFSTGWCGYCARLKQQLTKDGIAYTDINIEETPGTAEIVEQVNNGNQTVPTVIFPDGSSATNPSLAEVKSRL